MLTQNEAQSLKDKKLTGQGSTIMGQGWSRVVPWLVRVLPGGTLLGLLRARAWAGSNHYSLVRPV